MGEPTFFLGLQVRKKDNGIFISQDKYVAKILRKFGLTDGKLASTLIDTEKPLLKDPDDCLPNEEILAELARIGYEKPPLKLTFYKAFFSAQWKFLIHTIVQCMSAKRTARNEFSSSMASAVICLVTGVETPLFDTMLVQPQVQDVVEVEEDEDDEVFAAPTPPLPTPTTTSPSPTNTCATLTQKVAHLEQDKVAQVFEITKLKQRVRTLKRKRRSNDSGLKRLRKGKVTELDVDEDVTLVDVDTIVEMDADTQGRMEEDVTTVKEINDAESEPTVFNDEDVTMTMAWTLIKMKAKKARILDEQMAKRLQDEELEQAVAREKHKKEDLERAKMQEKHLDNIKKYQSLKRKPISVAQARKNMIVYLKNMAGYKIQHFKGMTYDQIRPIFEREYNHIQTFLKSDKDKEPTKKRAAKETMLQESFKKLSAEVEVSGSHSTQHDTPTVDPIKISKEDVQNMLQIVPMPEFKVEALQFKYLSLTGKFTQKDEELTGE
nr:retrovirus-related Pol polyprotein from transposon TNT 1-94 [Tanacetum cinerariifolium]